MNKKDPNYAAMIEKAIAEKYGVETIQNPKANWDEEKEKEYLEQLKKIAKKENQKKDKVEKIEVNGILINKKLINRKTEQRFCSFCNKCSKNSRDEAYMVKWNCCFDCYVQRIEGREERWKINQNSEWEKI